MTSETGQLRVTASVSRIAVKLVVAGTVGANQHTFPVWRPCRLAVLSAGCDELGRVSSVAIHTPNVHISEAAAESEVFP
jgi:hypothetical protein